MKILYFVAIVLLSSCTSSLVYSPSVGVTNKKIEKGDINLQAAYELLPETRPDRVEDNFSNGLNLGLSYGLTENTSLKLRGWNDMVKYPKNFRHGYSAGLMFDYTEKGSGWLFYPRVGILFDDNTVDGGGISFNSLYKMQVNKTLSLYGGVGLVLGWRDISNEVEKKEYGYGLLFNIGSSFDIYKGLGINFELNPVYQLNMYDEVNHFLVAPSIGFYYHI
jgi:hypothetical protein